MRGCDAANSRPHFISTPSPLIVQVKSRSPREKHDDLTSRATPIVEVSSREPASPSHSRPHSASWRNTLHLPLQSLPLPPHSYARARERPQTSQTPAARRPAAMGRHPRGCTRPAPPLATLRLQSPHRRCAQTTTLPGPSRPPDSVAALPCLPPPRRADTTSSARRRIHISMPRPQLHWN